MNTQNKIRPFIIDIYILKFDEKYTYILAHFVLLLLIFYLMKYFSRREKLYAKFSILL